MDTFVKCIRLSKPVEILTIVVEEKDFAHEKVHIATAEETRFLNARYSSLARAVCRTLDLPAGSVNVSSNNWVVGSRVDGTLLIISRKKRRELRKLERIGKPFTIAVKVVSQIQLFEILNLKLNT